MPFDALATVVRERMSGCEPAHDFLHVLRVVASARVLAEAEGARRDVVEMAALLHELFAYPKGHPESHRSGDVCAEHAARLLRDHGRDEAFVAAVCACIRDHAFSKGVVPETLEGRILQDADRLDAIGAIGVARCMATCAAMGRPFYAEHDPFCRERAPDGKAFGVDHFFEKLNKLPAAMHTDAARAEAQQRGAFLDAFLRQLEAEITP